LHREFLEARVLFSGELLLDLLWGAVTAPISRASSPGVSVVIVMAPISRRFALVAVPGAAFPTPLTFLLALSSPLFPFLVSLFFLFAFLFPSRVAGFALLLSPLRLFLFTYLSL